MCTHQGAMAEHKDEQYDRAIAEEKLRRKTEKKPANKPPPQPVVADREAGGEDGGGVSPRKEGGGGAKGGGAKGGGAAAKKDKAAAVVAAAKSGKAGDSKAKGGGGGGSGAAAENGDGEGGGEEASGGGGSSSNGSAAEVRVQIAAGAHAGKTARVLHVGNGWVKLQLASDASTVLHLRKWDLVGEIPLKMRSPARPGAAPSGGKAGAAEGGGSAAETHGKGDDVASHEQQQQQQQQQSGAANRKGRSGGDADAAASSAVVAEVEAEAEAEAKPKPKKRPVEPSLNGFSIGMPVWARWSGIKFSHGVISKLLTSSKWVLVTFDDGESYARACDAMTRTRAARRRAHPSSALREAHASPHALLINTKQLPRAACAWLGGGVRCAGAGKSEQWVTARELVHDEIPTPAVLEQGSEVIAAWEDEPHYYKGTIIGISKVDLRGVQPMLFFPMSP